MDKYIVIRCKKCGKKVKGDVGESKASIIENHKCKGVVKPEKKKNFMDIINGGDDN